MKKKIKQWSIEFGGKIHLYIGYDAPKIVKVEPSEIRGYKMHSVIIDECSDVLPKSKKK